MNKFAEIIVIEFKDGITVETFTRDEDFRTGTKTDELAGKTRIQWDSVKAPISGKPAGEYEWVKSDMLVKLDNRHLQLVRSVSEILPN